MNEGPENPYIFMPNFESGGGLYIREDKFDSMPNDQFKMLMRQLAPYQPEVQTGQMSEQQFLGNREDRKKNRESKRNRRDQKANSKAESRTTRANAKQTRADAKKSKADSGQGGIDWDKVKDVGGSLIGKVFNKGGDEGADASAMVPEPKPFYKNPIVIVGGIIVLAGAGYLLTRKKK
jgi:LPXTG-motif cell wall-anchored protein